MNGHGGCFFVTFIGVTAGARTGTAGIPSPRSVQSPPSCPAHWLKLVSSVIAAKCQSTPTEDKNCPVYGGPEQRTFEGRQLETDGHGDLTVGELVRF